MRDAGAMGRMPAIPEAVVLDPRNTRHGAGPGRAMTGFNAKTWQAVVCRADGARGDFGRRKLGGPERGRAGDSSRRADARQLSVEQLCLFVAIGASNRSAS